MRPCEKKVKCITFSDNHTKYQVVVVFGTFITSRVMTLIDNRRIYEGFLTVYTRGQLIPVSFFFFFFLKKNYNDMRKNR
jgi:hypothetical protein